MSVASANSPTSLTERERNRRLRRVDWRFLLERPVVDRILCLGSGDLRGGCGLIASHVDDHVIDGGKRYDVVVVQDPDDDTLALAFEQLGAAGTLYAEWGVLADPDAVRRRLMAAGFVDVRLYWPWPAPPHAEVWVPLDAPAAFDAYLAADRHVYSGWRHRVGTRARRALARCLAVQRCERTGRLFTVKRASLCACFRAVNYRLLKRGWNGR